MDTMDVWIMLPERSAVRSEVDSGPARTYTIGIVLTDAIGEGSESKTAHKPLRLKTFLMILVMIVTGPLGNVLLGKGMKHVGVVTSWPPSALLHTAFKVFASTSIWLGISSLILFFVSYMLVLSWADYSFVQPASSLAYGVVALLGYLCAGA